MLSQITQSLYSGSIHSTLILEIKLHPDREGKALALDDGQSKAL